MAKGVLLLSHLLSLRSRNDGENLTVAPFSFIYCTITNPKNQKNGRAKSKSYFRDSAVSKKLQVLEHDNSLILILDSTVKLPSYYFSVVDR